MKILTVSDEECPALWDYYVPGRLKEYDLIISCGDLKAEYLSFLVTMARCPVLYVHGNHDTGYDRKPPAGCDCIDDKLDGCMVPRGFDAQIPYDIIRILVHFSRAQQSKWPAIARKPCNARVIGQRKSAKNARCASFLGQESKAVSYRLLGRFVSYLLAVQLYAAALSCG